MDTIKFKADGVELTSEKGKSVLEALLSNGIYVPYMCHHPDLKPVGSCRLCVVEIEGTGVTVSCHTPLQEGMNVRTETPEVAKVRKSAAELLIANHNADCLSCYKDTDCTLQDVARYVGIEKENLELLQNLKPSFPIDDSNPYFLRDPNKCVLCGICIRTCDEILGLGAIDFAFRGFATVVSTFGNKPIVESICESCGECVVRCPTAALQPTNGSKPQRSVKSICPYCGTGCGIEIGVRGNKIVSIDGDADAPANKGLLCVKGRYSFGFNDADDRVTSPMIRKNGTWEECSWDDAYNHIASEFMRISDSYGADSIGVLGSARATNEENYLTQKFTRAVLGTNNVDCCARVCHAPSAAGLKMMLGTGAATNSFDDIEQARTILVTGSNTTENHPIVGTRIRRAKLNGANLIVIDPRKIELTRLADIHLQIHPGTNVPLFNSIAYVIIDEKLYDEKFIEERLEDYTSFFDFVKDYSPEQVSEICGVPADLIRQAARLYASQKPSMCVHGLGMTEHTQGSESVMSLINIALLTGNIGKPGTGVNPLRGQNNVQGSAHMGCEPGNLTGFIPVEKGREKFEMVWNTPLPKNKGHNLMRMLDAAMEDKLKAMWLIGYDVYLTNPHADATSRKAFENMDMVIVQDMFMTETAKEFGTVFLPVASPYEKDGTFMNGERRVSRIRKAVEPPENVKTDWEIICGLAGVMEKGELFDFSSAEEIWNEVREVWDAGKGITYSRLDNGGVQWPCPEENHPGTTVLHGEEFPHGKRTSFREIPFTSTSEKTSKEYPFVLNTGRTLYHFNAGTMTYRTKNKLLYPEDYLYISNKDAEKLGVENKQRVRVRSAYGETVQTAIISDTVRPGELYTTFHTPEVFINKITNPNRDRFTSTPEYKVTAVQILSEK